MEKILNFFAKMTWQDWVAAIGFIFGVISFIAYWEQKRATKQQEKFFEFAKRHVDKDITEEQLKMLLIQKATMESQITQQIPLLARLAVLKEQAELHVNAIVGHYSQWKNIADEIASRENVSPIDPKIEAFILDKILPQYELRRYQETIRTRVTVLSISMALASSILPFLVKDLVVYMLAIPLVSSLLKLFSMQEDFSHYLPWIRRAIYLIYLGVIITASVLGSIILFGSFQLESVKSLGIVAWTFAGILLILSPLSKKAIDIFLNSLTKPKFLLK